MTFFLKHKTFQLKKGGNLFAFILCCLFLCMTLLSCSSSPHRKKNIVAMVDNEPITLEDLKYSLEIEHRRETLSPATARTIDISQYIQTIIDNKLIIQEALRMGLNQDPLIQKDIDEFVLRESVVRLRNEEILQKISITEEDVKNYYQKNYGKFFLSVIELNSGEKALEILDQLKRENNFTELSDEYPSGLPKNENNEVVAARKSMGHTIEQAVSGLKPGEFSDVLETNGKFYIIKLLRREEAPNEGFEGAKDKIKYFLKKEKEKELSNDYLEYLRKGSPVKIDSDILSSLNFDEGEDMHKNVSEDKRPLVTLHDSALTVGEFAAMVPPVNDKDYKKFLQIWIDRKVVDHEALSRHYEQTPELKNSVNRYKNALLKNKFITKVIVPMIKVSDKALENYYLDHKNDFLKPANYKIQQITAKTMEEASEILDSLKNGASFSWLAKTRSIDQSAQKGGDVGWVKKDQLSGPASEALALMKTGDISPVMEVDSLYRIIRLQEKAGEEVEEFDKIKDAVYKAYTSRQYNDLLKKYLDKLKEDAQITVYEDAVHDLQNRFKK